MHTSEWSQDYLIRKEVYITNNTVYVVRSDGYRLGLESDTGIVNAQWVGDAIVITYRGGQRVRYYGQYGSQRENI